MDNGEWKNNRFKMNHLSGDENFLSISCMKSGKYFHLCIRKSN